MKKRYEAIDLVKYICAICVIMVHTAPLLENWELGNFVIVNIVCRTAVPFFFVSSAYFLYKNMQTKGEGYLKKYLFSLLKTYIFWSVLYLPVGLLWVTENISLPLYLYPVALIIAFLYSGVFYHLWYFPALILGILFVNWFIKRFRFSTLFILAGFLFSFGALESYYGVLPNGFLRAIFDIYRSVFVTSRNFLFFGIIFVAMGFYLASEKRKVVFKYSGVWSMVFFSLTAVEALCLFETGYLDFNFLFMLVPFTLFFFVFLLQLKVKRKMNYFRLRQMSQYYYYVHGFFLMLVPLSLKLLGVPAIFPGSGLVRFFSVFFLTHMTTLIILHYKEKKCKVKQGIGRGFIYLGNNLGKKFI